jgi:hypothetical protein
MFDPETVSKFFIVSKHRWIVWFGGAILGHVAGNIVFHDPSVLGPLWVTVSAGANAHAIAMAIKGHAPAEWTAVTVPWILAGVMLVAGWMLDSRARQVSTLEVK